MAEQGVQRVYFYDVIRGKHDSIAYRRMGYKLADRRDYIRTIEDSASNNRFPGDLVKETPVLHESGDHMLEMDALDGKHAYVFRISIYDSREKFKNNIRLIFRSQPIVPIYIGSLTKSFIKDHEDIRDKKGLWASFVCDTEVVKSSSLAKKIRRLADHNDIMRIPFYLNVWDPLLDLAPWVLEPHDHDRSKAKRPGKIMTHGGVHPALSSSLVVSL
ncbi:MAG: hypothetical protein ABR601_01955 [Parasphingopyxis sp.]|nr:hypothetical protein [Sphingomonadales bacterium]